MFLCFYIFRFLCFYVFIFLLGRRSLAGSLSEVGAHVALEVEISKLILGLKIKELLKLCREERAWKDPEACAHECKS